MENENETKKPSAEGAGEPASKPAGETPPAGAGGGGSPKPSFFATGAGKAVVAAGGVAVVALIVAVVALATRPAAAPEETQAPRAVLVNEENAEEVAQEMLADYVPPGYYEASMNSTWYYPNGSTAPSSNAYVENVEGNTNDVYFDVEIADTGEVIYESPVIPRGMHLMGFPLDEALDPGTYDCTLTYHLIDEEQNTLSTLRMAVTVVVS